MTVWVYTIVHDEALMVPYWTRHYATFADRMVVYDDHSTDGTPDLARQGGAEVRPYPGNGLDDQAFVDFANVQYREARGAADWVIWVDGDEFLYHPRILERLAELKAEGVTLPRVDGYSMLAFGPPVEDGQIYDEIAEGFLHDRYSKPVILNPSLDIVWEVGKHAAYAPDAITNTDDPLRLLHYRYLGRQYHEQRNARNYQRLSVRNKRAGFTFEATPGWDGEYSANWYERQRPRAEVCV